VTANGHTIPVKPGTNVLVFSDIHFRQQDKRGVDILVDFARDLKPDISAANGDIHDANALSKHGRAAKEQVDDGALEDEAEASAPFLAAIKSATKDGGRLLYGAGNHEGRWDRFINDNPGLAGVPWWTPYRNAIAGWELFDQAYEWYLGPLTICHGDELVGSCTAHSTHKVSGGYPRENLLYGHTHRIERCTQTQWPQGVPHEHGVWTTGHLQDVSRVDWKKRTSWRLGFSVVQFWKLGRGVGFNVIQHELFRVGKGLVMHSPLTGKTYKG
jgi:hypothetical protein